MKNMQSPMKIRMLGIMFMASYEITKQRFQVQLNIPCY